MDCKILTGCALQQLPELESESIDCCVTSPPYFGLRNYGTEPSIWGGVLECEHVFVERKYYTEKSASVASCDAFHEAGPENAERLKKARWRSDATCKNCGAWRGNLGMEPTPQMFVEHLVMIFRQVKRVLRDDGNLYLNLGDSYAQAGGAHGGREDNQTGVGAALAHLGGCGDKEARRAPSGYKPKDLIGIPWMTAFALRSDGWYLREEIIWHKPNCMPESVTDRCTRSHEQIFHLTKSRKYFYDAAAIKNPPSEALMKQIAEGYAGKATKDFEASGAQDASATKSRIIENARKKIDKQRGHSRRHDGFNDRWDALSRDEQMPLGSNKRSVWTVAPANYKAAHFATFPPDLIRPCILAGCPLGGTVLDPFAGSGTTGQVALSHGRSFVGIELNPAYVKLIEDRISNTQPGFM